jgi:hypothetical protein
MADNTVKDILLLGLVAVGGYFLWEWLTAPAVSATTTTTPTPGTTPTMVAAGAPTSVSTVPTTTPTTGGGAQGTSAAMPTVQQPTAADLQSTCGGNATMNADQWNYCYRQLMGAGIDSVFNFNFNTVYGAVQSNGTRSSGQMTASAFLSAPGNSGFVTPQTPQGSSSLGAPLSIVGPRNLRVASRANLAGLAAITHFYTPVVNPLGSMVYRAQHPSPYRYPMTGGSGFSGFTQPTGFEAALWGSGSLWRNKLP